MSFQNSEIFRIVILIWITPLSIHTWNNFLFSIIFIITIIYNPISVAIVNCISALEYLFLKAPALNKMGSDLQTDALFDSKFMVFEWVVGAVGRQLLLICDRDWVCARIRSRNCSWLACNYCCLNKCFELRHKYFKCTPTMSVRNVVEYLGNFAFRFFVCRGQSDTKNSTLYKIKTKIKIKSN